MHAWFHTSTNPYQTEILAHHPHVLPQKNSVVISSLVALSNLICSPNHCLDIAIPAQADYTKCRALFRRLPKVQITVHNG